GGLEATAAALGPQDLDRGEMRPVTRARTELALPAGSAALSIKLPATAGDRDRVRVKSDATTISTIRNDGIDFTGTLRVAKGNVYDFMWAAEKKRWVPMTSPTVALSVNKLSGGRMPDMSTPTTRLQSSDGNWASSVVLPAKARPGDRVIVESSASWGFGVVPGGAPATFASQPVSNGDTIAFVVDAQGRWTRETRTIDMLNIYADRVVAAYGVQAARARQLESFRLTNEALENSGANFRLKMVGLMQHRDQGASLGDALNKLRDDPVVQNERKRLKADALYYEGAEEGCGLAWVNSSPSAYNMVASGSIHCGTTVMRHEFGHNMGLQHGGTPGTPVYATGYSLLGTVMGGNAIPYFSTPRRYDARIGVPMGVVNVIDATRAMDEHSEEVSNFYR
ncbi:MAG TPA: zinc-dependent metalloprotease family protein, partial [Variovorax sp.]|nr:zinc-dependent metalloprotease family protein [Variovorax sp.]